MDHGFVTSRVERENGNKRFIAIHQKVGTYPPKGVEGYPPKGVYNNTYSNNTMNIVSKETTTLSVEVEEYTPSEITKRINDLIKTIKDACVANGIVYGNSTQERNYAKHILSKKFNEDCLDQVGMDMDQFIHSIVKASVMLLYSKPLNSAKSIYY